VRTPSGSASARARTTERASVGLSTIDKQLWISQASPTRFDGVPAAAARSPGNMPPAARRQTVYAECGYYSRSSARTYMLDGMRCVSNWVGLTESSPGIPNRLQISASLAGRPRHCALPRPPPPWLRMVGRLIVLRAFSHECRSRASHTRAHLKGLRGG